MSVVKADRFTFTALKARVKTEMQRRNQSGSVAGYGGSTYDYAVAPAAGGVVRAEHRDKLVTPMRAVNNSKFQTEEQVATAINAKVSSAYKAGGSVAFAALPTPDEAEASVFSALKDGYRLIDTANAYVNEKAVGRAMRASGLPWKEIFLETKLWPS